MTARRSTVRLNRIGIVGSYSGASDMDQLLIVLIVLIAVSGFAGLAHGALHWGVDSRAPLPDDHRR